MTTHSNSSGGENTSIASILPIDGLIQPTLERLQVTSLEELAALDIGEVGKVKGLGIKKLEVLGRLIIQARVQLSGVSANVQATPKD